MAYSFASASSQSLSVASTPATAVPITIAQWLYIPSHTGVSRSIAHVGSTNANGCRLQITSGNRLQLLHIGAQQANISQTDTQAATGTWLHVCGVYASLSSRSLYVNGVLQAATTTDITSQTAFEVIIVGARQLTTLGQFLDGYIGDFGVWNAAITADEVVSLSKGFACSKIRPQSLVFYAPLSRNLTDVRGNLAITNNNAATVANHPRIYL